MGRTIHHRRSQAVPITPRSTAQGTDRRGGRGRHAAGIPGRSSMTRVFALIIGIGLCAGAAYAVYNALDGAFLSTRPNLDVVDRPVSNDSSVVSFQVRPGQSAQSIGE